MVTESTQTTINQFFSMIPDFLKLPVRKFWIDYDKDADVLYINYLKPQRATDSEMLENGILVRYKDDDIIGLTILDASTRE